MSKMVMSAGEIVREYNAAKKKREQIDILADLNCCSKWDICDVLIAGGIPAEELPKKPGRKKPAEAVEAVSEKPAEVKAEPIKVEAVKPAEPAESIDALKESYTALWADFKALQEENNSLNIDKANLKEHLAAALELAETHEKAIEEAKQKINDLTTDLKKAEYQALQADKRADDMTTRCIQVLDENEKLHVELAGMSAPGRDELKAAYNKAMEDVRCLEGIVVKMAMKLYGV